MLGWYIHSSKTEESYLKVVNRTVTPAMNYFCDEINKVEFDNLDDSIILKLFDDIIQTMPFLELKTRKDVYSHPDDFWIKYNSYTQIRFVDGLKSIKRDIVINKILK